jgi:hypothetical protein
MSDPAMSLRDGWRGGSWKFKDSVPDPWPFLSVVTLEDLGRVVHCLGWNPPSEAVPPDHIEWGSVGLHLFVYGSDPFVAFGAPSLIHGG